MRVQVFIDNDGRKVSVQAVLRDWQPVAASADDTLSRYLVSTAGYVFVEQDLRRLRVSINFDAASDEAITSLIYEIYDHEQFSDRPLFAIDRGKIIQTFDTAGRAVNFITDQWEGMQSRRTYRAHRRRVPLVGESRAPFRQLLFHCSSSRLIELSRSLHLLRTRFSDRYLIVRPNSDSGQLILTHIGDGYSHIDAAWRQHNLGAPFGEFENKGYSDFVKDAYREAWCFQQPVLEEIDSPQPSRSPNEWISYERLLVPILIDEGPAMLSATLMTA